MSYNLHIDLRLNFNCPSRFGFCYKPKCAHKQKAKYRSASQSLLQKCLSLLNALS